MGKRGKSPKSGNRYPKKTKLSENGGLEDMNDEIDLFHKQKDKIPIDINEENEESDDDNELPVFDYKGIGEDDEDGDEEDEEGDDEDDGDPGMLVRKIKRTQKLLKAKHGNLEDDTLEDAEDKETEPSAWGKRKSIFYDGDNVDYELQSSDEDSAQEEEAEVIRLRKEAAKSMTVEDVGIDEDENDETDREPTIEEMLIKGKDARTSQKNESEDIHVLYEKVTKDLSSLSKDEQMDIVYSSAPELVGLLSALNDALEQLDNSVNPILSKVQNCTVKMEELQYLELKKQLLLTYCQAIAFYLLLKSEGQPVRDHPVIARLVEIKSLLDKIEELDANLLPHLEELLEEKKDKTVAKSVVKNSTVLSNVVSEMKHRTQTSSTEAAKLAIEELQKIELFKENVPNADKIQTQKKKPVNSQSAKMLSTRAALEEKLKQKGLFTTIEPVTQGSRKHKLKPHNCKLETFDDFDDDAMDSEEMPTEFYGKSQSLSNRVSQYLTAKGKKTKVSGDEDLPKRDDLGERRRKFEMQVLARAGVKSMDKDDDGNGDDHDGAESGSNDDDDNNSPDVGGDETDGSEDEFYQQVKQQRNQRLATKQIKYSRDPVVSSAPELTVDGKRHITTQIEKNRGLTRNRKKLIKNPRKKYKLKHEKAKKRHLGQVRQIVKPDGPYGGQKSGINIMTSRSIRLDG